MWGRLVGHGHSPVTTELQASQNRSPASDAQTASEPHVQFFLGAELSPQVCSSEIGPMWKG